MIQKWSQSPVPEHRVGVSVEVVQLGPGDVVQHLQVPALQQSRQVEADELHAALLELGGEVVDGKLEQFRHILQCQQLGQLTNM